MTTPTPERAAELPELPSGVGWFKYDRVSCCWHPQYDDYAPTHATRESWERLFTADQMRAYARAALAAARPSEAQISVAAFCRLHGRPWDSKEPLVAPRPEVPPPDVVDPAGDAKEAAN